MELVLLALCASALTAGPAAAAWLLWRGSRTTERPAPATVNALLDRRSVRAFVLERPDGRVDVSCETQRTGRQLVVLRVAVPDVVWVEPVRPLRLADRALGDPEFDRRFECGGEVVLLDADARALLLEASRVLDLRVVGGTLEGRWSATHEGRAGFELTLEPHADRLLAIARAISADPDEAWLRTALHDRTAAVRIRAIEHLVATGSARAPLALQAGCRSTVPEVALTAARLALDLPVLRRLACDEALPRELRRAALEVLFERDDDLARVIAVVAATDAVADVVSLVERHGAERHALLAAATLRTARRPLPDAVRHDAEHALADLLGGLAPSPAAEDELLSLLGSDYPPAVRAAARALGAIGTGRSVAPLRALRAPADVARAAAGAVREIQARAAGREGGMALAAEHALAGALSPSTAPGGDLAELRRLE